IPPLPIPRLALTWTFSHRSSPSAASPAGRRTSSSNLTTTASYARAPSTSARNIRRNTFRFHRDNSAFYVFVILSINSSDIRQGQRRGRSASTQQGAQKLIALLADCALQRLLLGISPDSWPASPTVSTNAHGQAPLQVGLSTNAPRDSELLTVVQLFHLLTGEQITPPTHQSI